MQNWEYMTVQVCLDASSCVYTVVYTGDQGYEEEHSLSEFLLDMGKLGWEYVDLNENRVTLKRLRQE
jgi:hypothetical protein